MTEWPRLTVNSVRDYLGRVGIVAGVDVSDRRLCACLFAAKGRGFVFLDADDPAGERRFSLAHELAHYLRDVDAPRRRLVASMGAAATAVLDGAAPTVEQRVAAVLRGVSLTAHVHLLHRDETGQPLNTAEREAEAAADRLACELLAPAAGFAGQPAARIHERLVDEFGLPTEPAAAYSRILCPPVWRDPLLARLT